MLVIVRFLCFLLLILKVKSVEIETKVVNGVEATNFIPHQASIRVSIRDNSRFGRGHTCGGVLIARGTVTTAAHCLFDGQRLRNAFDLRVILGSLNRYKFTDDTVIRTAEKIIVHPEYRRGQSFAHDIGLIILRSPIEFTNHIHSIPIIEQPVEDFAECQVSGWGATSWQSAMPAELRKGNVSIVPRRICGSEESYGSTIVDGMVCANGYNEHGIVDICQGDSGGPLICGGRLVGLSSFGARCGYLINFPGVFADVYYYREWIFENWSGCDRISNSFATVGLVFVALSVKILF